MSSRGALLITLLALGIGRLSVIPVELAVQGLISIWPQIFDGLTVTSADGGIDASRSMQLGGLLKEALYSVVAIAICLLIRRDIKLMPQLDCHLLRNAGLAVAIGLVVGFVVRAGITLINPVDPASDPDNLKVMAESSALLAGTYVLRVCLLAPLEEEFIYRGIVFNRAGPLASWQLAALSILPWAFDHVAGGGLWQASVALVAGPAYFWVRKYTGHFGYAVVTHALFNAIQIWQ